MSYELRVIPAAGAGGADPDRVRTAILALQGCEGGSGPLYRVLPEELTVEYPATESEPLIILHAALPVLDVAGPRALNAALELAKVLRWSVFDPQLDASIDQASTDRVLASQRAWKEMASAAVRSLVVPVFPSGWTHKDGWWVPPSDQPDERLRVLAEPPARSYTWRDQLKAEARSPIALGGWLASFASLVAGAALLKWYLLAFAGLWFWMFGPTFWRLVRLRRDGTVRVFVAKEVTPVPLVKDKASLDAETSPKRKIAVIVPLAATRGLIARHGAVEVQLLVLDGISENALLGMRAREGETEGGHGEADL